MDERWSRHVQHADMLDSTRAARFTPKLVREIAANADSLPGHAYLELGCGTGAMLRAFARQYPQKVFTGLDRDTAFIAYARARARAEGLQNLSFVEGDVYALPFADAVFDGTMSHTVLEHVEPARFFAEQGRVLKRGGQCLTMSVFPSASLYSAQETAPKTEEEDTLSAIGERVYALSNQDEALVARYALSAHEIPPAMSRAGFSQVKLSCHAVSVSLQPNDEASEANLSAELAEKLANVAMVDALEADWAEAHSDYVRVWTRERQERMKALIEERYTRKRALLPQTWVVNARMMLLVRGIKP